MRDYKIPRIAVLSVCLALGCFMFAGSSGAQSWSEYDIDESGCSAFFPFQPLWEFYYTEDSSTLWTAETYEGEIYYGVICVEFEESLMDATGEDIINLAQSYLDYLQTEYSIVSHTGYVVDYTHPTNDHAFGVSDSWTDDEGDPWEVKAWINDFNLVVMFTYADKDYFNTDKRDYFFESLRFPGD